MLQTKQNPEYTFSWLVEEVAVYKRKWASRFILFITKGNHNANLKVEQKYQILEKELKRKYAKLEISLECA